MGRAWRCLEPACTATLGTIGRDGDGTDVLNLAPGVTLVRIDFRAASVTVQCACGRPKRWCGGRVVITNPRRALTG